MYIIHKASLHIKISRKHTFSVLYRLATLTQNIMMNGKSELGNQIIELSYFYFLGFYRPVYGVIVEVKYIGKVEKFRR